MNARHPIAALAILSLCFPVGPIMLAQDAPAPASEVPPLSPSSEKTPSREGAGPASTTSEESEAQNERKEAAEPRRQEERRAKPAKPEPGEPPESGTREPDAASAAESSPAGSPDARAGGESADPQLDVAPDSELAEISKEIISSFDRVRRLLDVKHEEIAGTISTASLPELTDALRAWENAKGDRTDKVDAILAALERLRTSVAVDLLVVVSQRGDVFAAPRRPVRDDTDETFRDEASRAAGPALRSQRASRGAAVFTVRKGDPAGRRLFLTATSPIFLRPDAPQFALVGGVSMATCANAVEATLESNASHLDWHVFVASGPGEWTAILGPRSGQSPAPGLVEALRSRPTATGSGFRGGPEPLGLWARISGSDGNLIGGWGIGVNESFLDTFLSTPPSPAAAGSSSASGSDSWLGGKDAALKVFFLVLAATGGLGLVLVTVLAVVNMLRRRRVDVEIASADGVADVPTPAAASGDDLASQFERNWKTFASYTQDLLHQTLKDIEQAPQQDVRDIRERVELALQEVVNVRKDVARIQSGVSSSSNDELNTLAGTLVEIRNQLSIARDEVKNSSNGVVRRVTAALRELSPPKTDYEDLLRRVELELLETKQGFGLVNETVLKLAEIFGEKQTHEIERTIEEELATAQGEWEARENEYQHQIDHAREQMEPLLKELEEARQNERELRGDLEEAAARQARLEADLDEEKAKTEFLTAEREEAWRKERKVVEELREAERRHQEAPEKVRALEATLHELEVEVEELREREKKLREELEATHASELEAREQLNEHTDGEQSIRAEFEEERQRMRSAMDRLAAKNAELEKRAGEDPTEKDRLREQIDAQAKELESIRGAFEALKVEKLHLEKELERLGTESAERLKQEGGTTQALRTELAKLKADLAASQSKLSHHLSQAELHDEVVDDLRSALADRETDLARAELELNELRSQLEVLETASGTADMERLQTSLIDTGRELRQSLQERLALNTEIKEREAVWQSRLNTLELQVTEANRKLQETQNKLVESDEIIRNLESQLRAVHETTRPDARTYERIQDLKREKQDLVRSLEGLKRELATLQTESDQALQLREALIGGSAPAAIVACDKKLKVHSWSSEAERLWELTSSEVLGRSIAELDLTPDGRLTTLAKATVRSGDPESMDDLVWSPPNHDSRHLRIHCDPLRDREKGVVGAVLYVQDITAEVEQRTEARVQNLFAESLAESLPAALVILDGRDRVTSWNQVAERLFGIESDQAIGQELFSLETPLNRSVFKRRFLKAKQQKKQKKVRIRMEVAGSPTQCVVTQCPFKSAEDKARGTLLLVEEVAAK